MGDRLVDVAVPVSVPGTFHYLAPISLETPTLEVGQVVEVPFRHSVTHAFVVGFPDTTDVPASKLKPVSGVLAEKAVFDEAMLKFLKWVADYYCHPLGEVIDSAVPRVCWKPKKKAPKQKPPDMREPSVAPPLTEEQAFALARILEIGSQKPVLLHGVTGSGKTEVYMRILEHVLKQGQGALVLVPEIALTPQLSDRFSARFPGQVAVLHSDLKPSDRYNYWRKIHSGESKIVVGARSAVFAPIQNLGLVVVDEEHESSYKQEDSPRYHARDIAIVRANLCGARVVLGSATPSVESYYNAQNGKFAYITLKERVHKQALPKTSFVDLKERGNWIKPEIPWLTRPLVSRLENVLKAGQQAMLFLNRLGFAHFIFCEDCGHTWRCKSCDVSLTFYKTQRILKCHYCGMQKKVPPACEECQGTSLKPMGVGTEQVEQELGLIFPQARIARMDRSALTHRNDLENLLTRIQNREVDIIVGTQMMAKGHDFPGIALVGVLMADASLNLPDFRANERTFQILTQVSGRAGRADTPGEVVVQTVNPEHPVLIASAEYRCVDFYRNELAMRERAGFPPYQRLVMLRFQHKNLDRVRDYSVGLSNWLREWVQKQRFQCQILGPSEAPLARLKNAYRWQCLLKSPSIRELQAAVRAIQHAHQNQRSPIHLSMDVDPIHSL